MNRIALALPLLALGTTGCLEAAVLGIALGDAVNQGGGFDDDYSYDDGYYDEDSNYYDDYQEPEAYDVLDGAMLGSIVDYGQIDREVTQGTLWRSDDWIDLEIHSTTSDWAMIIGSVDTSRLEEGVPTELSFSEFNIMSCGGTEQDNADLYDVPLDTVVVTEEVVEIDGEQLIELTIAGMFGDGGSLDTTVVVPMPDED